MKLRSLALAGCLFGLLGGAATAAPTMRLEAFNYKDVVLTGGPMAVQAREAAAFFLALDENSLLQGFRLRAGLPAPGKPMGGWYDPDDFAAAHPFGQFISGLARMYANTGDVRYQQKVARLVHGFHQTMASDGYFFASKKVEKEWPCYLYDKNCTGMRDAYTLTGNKEALVVLRQMTDWAVQHLPTRADEWYTMQENLYNCYALTGEKRYLDLAKHYEYHDFWDALANGENAFIPDRHAYSHINSLCSAARAYEATGDEKYLKTVENAFDFLVSTQMFASGGWGPNEHWIVPGKGNLAASLTSTAAHFETPCGSYANVNLDRYLLRFTGDSKYGDNMERVLLNGMLTVLPMRADGSTFYYSDYRPGTTKHYFSSAWPCCAGTFAEITADYPRDIYLHDAGGLYVNLFVPSNVTWHAPAGTVRMEQTTSYPLSNTVSFVVHDSAPVQFDLHVRVPYWATGPVAMTVNGAPAAGTTTQGFVGLQRLWHDGDRVVVTVPSGLRFEAIAPESPDRVALMQGPLLLVALSKGDVELHGDRANPSAWIKPVDDQGTYRTDDGAVTFRPLYQITDQTYTTYSHL